MNWERHGPAGRPLTLLNAVGRTGDNTWLQVVTIDDQAGWVSAAYVVDGDRLALRQLRMGARHGDRFEVLAGLRRGERIAADPAAAVEAMARQREAAGARDD